MQGVRANLPIYLGHQNEMFPTAWSDWERLHLHARDQGHWGWSVIPGWRRKERAFWVYGKTLANREQQVSKRMSSVFRESSGAYCKGPCMTLLKSLNFTLHTMRGN